MMGMSLACLPLLRPIGDAASTSPIVNWVKELVPSSLGGPSWNRTKGSGGNDRYVPTGSEEGLQPITHVTIGGTEHKIWVAPNAVHVTGGQKALKTDKQWKEPSLEMTDRP